MSSKVKWLITLAIVSAAPSVGAQDLESASEPAVKSNSAPPAEQEIESLYDKDESRQAPKATTKAPTKAEPAKDAHTLSDLANLAAFDDVAVIQRRFLPKTGRFETSASLFTNMNNPFFNAIGVVGRFAYYVREQYAVELVGLAASTSTRQVTDDLLSNRKITTDNVVTTKSFEGVAFKWNPIYGKITWLNKLIVPFDLNFNVGLGMTQTGQGESDPTLHLGTSQIFALSKSLAFRWDLIWNTFHATSKLDDGTTQGVNQNDLFLGFGFSYYFPEAKYR